MNECEWFNAVDDLLHEKEILYNLDNDLWIELFEGGYSPEQAILEMT